MNQYISSDFAFAGTTIDPLPVRKYLFNMKLGYYETAYDRGMCEESLKLLNYTEVFEIRFRRYLAGAYKTLHITMADVRAFLLHSPQAAKEMIKLVILQIRQRFLTNEWYELMPRLEKAAVKIQRLLI